MKKLLTSLAAVTLASSLLTAGCAAISTAINKNELDVSTKMTNTIFIDPCDDNTVYLQIRNTSNKDFPYLKAKIANQLTDNGYVIVDKPSKANYWIQANVLYADKTDLLYKEAGSAKGASGAIIGGAIGAGVTSYNSDSTGAAIAVGALGALLGYAIDSAVDDTEISMVTDVQISVRSDSFVDDETISKLPQGSSSNRVQNVYGTKDRVSYQTQVLSRANKMNLEFSEAQDALENELAKAIGNAI